MTPGEYAEEMLKEWPPSRQPLVRRGIYEMAERAIARAMADARRDAIEECHSLICNRPLSFHSTNLATALAAEIRALADRKPEGG